MSKGETPPTSDRCPQWAADLIAKILELEIRLGNVRPSGEEWQVAKVKELYERLENGAEDQDLPALDAEAAEALFIRVAKGLLDEDFSAPDIAMFINDRIPSGKLPYCSATEVLEAAGKSRS